MSLNIAARALTTNQSVLGVIGHNIANANTAGYSRQSVSLDSVAGQKLGNGYFGKGVEIAAVKRSYDAFLTKQANSTATVAAGDEVRFQKMQQVEALFPLGAGSVGAMLNTALNAWVDVQSSATDSTARQVVIDQADAFAARLRETYTRLSEIGQTAKLQSAELAKSVNQLAQQIGDLNSQVIRASSTGVPPNDLLDQRDFAVAELNKLVKVSTIAADGGSLSVFVAGSQPLVLGSKAAQLAVSSDPVDPDYRQQLEFVLGSSRSVLDPSMLGGGEIKGLQQFLNEDLPQAMGELGRVALATAVQINLQHQSGLRADGTAGGKFFNFDVPIASPTSSAVPFSLQFQAMGLTADDYTVSYTAANTGTVQRVSDGAYLVPGPPQQWTSTATSINFAAYSASAPLEFDGVQFTPTAAGAAGDEFHFAPGRDAARSLSVNLASASEVAAATRTLVSPGAGNTGTGVIESFGVTLVNEAGGFPSPIPTFQLTYNSATSSFAIGSIAPALGVGVSLTPAATVAYTPGRPMTVTYTSTTPAREFTYQLTVRGEPANGDTFDMALVNPGDPVARYSHGNASSILALRDQTVFDGTVVLSDAYVAAFSGVASTLNESKVNAEFSAAQAAQAETQRANVSGVNLDEEAALLIQYQQAYQASAKYMSTVQSLFDTLMSAFR